MPAPSDVGAHRAAYDRLMAEILRRAAARIAAQAETQLQETEEANTR